VFTDLLGFDPSLPWQWHAMACLTAQTDEIAKDGAYKFRTLEGAVVVSRQNGKTDLAERRAVLALFQGKRVLHTAADLALPMKSFQRLTAMFKDMVPPQHYKITARVGHEEIKVFTPHGTGTYTLKAPKRSGSTMRGPSSDLIIIDEYLIFENDDMVSAAKPQLLTRPTPQLLYLSNAGGIESVPLRALRERGVEGDESLCWLEWSAPTEAALDSEEGALQANPAIGHLVNLDVMLANRASMTETQYRKEHLCQFVASSGEAAYPLDPWRAGATEQHPERTGPFSVSVDTDPLRRVAVAVSVYPHDGGFHVRCEQIWDTDPNEPGSALDNKLIANDVVGICERLGTGQILIDPYTSDGIGEHIRDRLEVVRVSRQNIITAGAATFDLISAETVTHPANDFTLDAHIAASTRMPTTDGGWRISRKGADPIPAAVAGTLALWSASLPTAVNSVGF
jgi:hypothetical protein